MFVTKWVKALKKLYFLQEKYMQTKKKKKKHWEIAAVRQSRSTILDINQKDIRK
jgi:hypothetical protein